MLSVVRIIEATRHATVVHGVRGRRHKSDVKAFFSKSSKIDARQTHNLQGIEAMQHPACCVNTVVVDVVGRVSFAYVYRPLDDTENILVLNPEHTRSK